MHGPAFSIIQIMTESNSSNPWLTLWYQPARTLQGLLARGTGEGAARGIALGFGLVLVWPRYAAQESGGLGVLLLGGAVALGGLYLFSWLLRNFSRWFGGAAHLGAVRIALGWGLLPWTVLPGLLLLYITTQAGAAGQPFPLFFGSILYGFVILLSMLSAGLGLSPMKTFFCFLFTLLVSLFPLTLVLQVLTGSGFN